MNPQSSSSARFAPWGSLLKSASLSLGFLAFGATSQVFAAGYTQAILATSSDTNPTTGAAAPQIEAIPLQVTATQLSPPSITIETYGAGTYTISRKDPSAKTWTQQVAGITLAANGTWTDTNVNVGQLYEYQFINTASTPYENDYPTSIYATGYILCGFQVDQTQPKGLMAVVVANDLPGNMPTQYSQYKSDLVADGWQVREIQVPRAANYNGEGNAAVGNIGTIKVNSGGTTSAASGSGFITITNGAGKKAIGTMGVSGGAISSVTISNGGEGSGFSVGDSLTVSGGNVNANGSTAATLQANVSSTQSTLSYADPITGGSGYTNGATVTLTGQTSGATVQCTLIVNNGAIQYFNIPASAPGFIAGEVITLSGNTTGSGIGPMTAYVYNGNLNYVYIFGPGTGYTQGEAGVLTGNQSGATANVTLDLYQGYIDGVTVVSSQSGFISGETLTLSGTATGSGAGLFNSYVSATGPLQSVTVVSGGTGYTNGANVQIIGGASVATGTLTVASGAITAVNVTNGGSGFTGGNYLNLAPVTTGYNLTVLTLDNSDVGFPVTISSGGSGYFDNDTVVIKGNSSGATATGSLIVPSATSAGGPITGISVVLPNTFTSGESLTITPTLGGSGVSAVAGSSTVNHVAIRSAVQALYTSFPGQLKNVVMVGKVPVCRTGLNDGAGSDGHGNEAPYGADAFYAEMLGIIGPGGDWTDTGDNSSDIYTDINLPGDQQYDQQDISQIDVNGNGGVELGYGRIDLSQSIQTEIPAEIGYFNKLHLYKIADPSFLPGRNVCDRLGFPNEREADIGAMPGVVGMNNINFITSSNLPAVQTGQDADQLYSTQNGPYLFYFKGNGGPEAGVNGKAVFWTGMQSHWGYWYQTSLQTSGSNDMQLRLAENSFTLDFTWNIWGLRYDYHRMGMGLDAGDMMKTSINNQGWSTGPYTYKFNNTSNGDYHGVLYMDQMGDPALRLFMFAPPTGLSVVKTNGNPVLTWTASTEPTVTGYHVYRAAYAGAPFTRLTTTPVPSTGSLTYTDTSATSGSYVYMVRAIRLESTGGGSFYNASLGTTQSINLGAAPTQVTISTTSLAAIPWNTPTTIALSATGGVPQYVWTLANGSGALPTGLTLSPLGVISGTTTATGPFNFTVQATDQIGQIATQPLTLTVNNNSQTVIYPTATTYTQQGNPTTSFGTYEADSIIGGTGGTTPDETFQRYNLSGVALNNGFVKATLYLYVTSGTTANAYAPVQANLLADSVDSWIANGIAVPFSGAAASPTSGWTRITTTVPYNFVSGTLVTLAGLTGFPTTAYAITDIDATDFDIHIAYAGWAYDPALAFVSTASMTYNTRPTTYDPNVGTLTASGTDTPGTYLQIDVTPFVTEVLNNFADKQMGLRLFTGTPQTVTVGSLNSFGSSIPYLVIQTSNAPKIVVNSPTLNPAYLYAGSSILLNTTVTPLASRASSLTVQWTQVSGPGTTTFTNPTSQVTGATFSTAGTYVLQITANDGVESSSQTITVSTQNNPVTGPTDSMVLRLPFDETSGTTANDSSGVTPPNNGTLTADPASNTLPTWVPSGGKIAGALSFAGSDSAPANYQQVVVPDSSTNQLDGMKQLAISFWFYANSLPYNGTSYSGSYAGLICKRLAASSKESYTIELRGSSATAASIYTDIGGTGSSVLEGASITTGKWYHCVVMFDGTQTTNNFQQYINGYPYKFQSSTQTTVPRNATSNLHIGAFDTADTNASNGGFNGLIDEVRIYNRLLTFAEVQALYQAVPTDLGPVITTTSPLTGAVGNPLALSATVSDSKPASALNFNWSEVSGPSTLTIASPTSISTSTTPGVPGAYGLQFSASDGIITTFANVAATITGQTYASWAAQNNLTGAKALQTAVLGNDGLNNLFKYALGLSPYTTYNPGSTGLPSVSIQNISGTNYLTLTFDGVATDVTYKVQATSDLKAGWTTIQTFPSGNAAPGNVTVQDSQPVSASPNRYMRLYMTNP